MTRFATTLTLILALLVLTGCGAGVSREVAAFSAAAESMLETSSKGFEHIAKAELDRTVVAIAADTEKRVGDDSFDGSFEQELILRRDYIAKLNSYAKALGTLASADDPEAVNAGYGNLIASLYGLGKTANVHKLSDTAKQAFAGFGAAAAAISNVMLEKAKRDALTEVVRAADPPIQKSADVLAEELAAFGQFIQLAYNDAYSRSVNAYNTQRKQMSFYERLRTLESIHTLKTRKATVQEFYEELQTAPEDFAAAHGAIRNVLEKDSITMEEIRPTIEGLFEKAATMQSQYAIYLESLQ